jgi:hypothetical protein
MAPVPYAQGATPAKRQHVLLCSCLEIATHWEARLQELDSSLSSILITLSVIMLFYMASLTGSHPHPVDALDP